MLNAAINFLGKST